MKSSREVVIGLYKQASRRFGRPLAGVDSKAIILSVVERVHQKYNIAVQNMLIQFSQTVDKGIRDVLATNPHARFEVVLESDKYLPEDSRPVLIYRYLTGIEQKELSRKWASLDKIKDGEKSLDVTFETATIGLISNRNVTDRQGEPIEFAADRLQEIMGMAEGHELIAKVFSQRPNVEDKKKLDSPLPSSTGQSAEAAPALQNARTSQQQPSPSESDVPDVTGQDASNAKRAGRIDITECPLIIITGDVWETIEEADFLKKGLPPIAGGLLDQAAAFIEAARFVFGEQEYYKSKIIDMES